MLAELPYDILEINSVFYDTRRFFSLDDFGGQLSAAIAAAIPTSPSLGLSPSSLPLFLSIIFEQPTLPARKQDGADNGTTANP